MNNPVVIFWTVARRSGALLSRESVSCWIIFRIKTFFWKVCGWRLCCLVFGDIMNTGFSLVRTMAFKLNDYSCLELKALRGYMNDFYNIILLFYISSSWVKTNRSTVQYSLSYCVSFSKIEDWRYETLSVINETIYWV